MPVYKGFQSRSHLGWGSQGGLFAIESTGKVGQGRLIWPKGENVAESGELQF